MPEHLDEADVYEFINTMAECIHDLKPVIAGEIKREHCVGSREAYGGIAGYRKTMLKDARAIAKSVAGKINNAIAKLEGR